MNKILLFASMMAVAMMTSCSEDEEKVVDQSSLELDKKEITIEETKTETLKATLTPTKEGDIYAWDSENKEIATVDKDGVVTAKKTGSTTISVTARGLKATCKVIVTAPSPGSLELNKKEITIEETKTETLKATLTPAKEGDTYTWESENDKVATVDKYGVVTAGEVGNTTITVTARGLTATCKVTVTASASPAITFKDAAFKEYLTKNKAINSNNDNVITEKEAAEFTGTINIQSLQITTIEEINYFKKLTGLNCTQTKIQSLNLEQNTALKSLICSNNSELITLNLSEKNILKTLFCGDTQITILNLKENTESLETLYCKNTKIKELDVRKNTKLKNLNCDDCIFLTGSTGTTTLDLSNNKDLTTLYCRGTMITKIIVWKGFTPLPGWNIGSIPTEEVQ